MFDSGTSQPTNEKKMQLMRFMGVMMLHSIFVAGMGRGDSVGGSKWSLALPPYDKIHVRKQLRCEVQTIRNIRTLSLIRNKQAETPIS